VQQDVMDPRMRHTIYHKMGFRLLDFEYVMPPLGKGFEKLKGVLLLTVYLTPHIPWLPLTNGGKYYYLPSVLLKNFISGQWLHAYSAGRTDGPGQDDPDFRMSIDQIELREKIPLLDLPWGDGKDWTVVDLWEDYDEDLLDAFYRKYMTTQFGTSDEIEPLENWHKALSTEGRDDPNICDLHVLLSLLLSGEHKGHKGHKYIVGGLVFEYYPTTNCALVTYVVVNEQYSNKGIGTDLLRRAITILDQNAKTKGHISGCNAIFLEVKFVQSASESVSHQFLFNKGFRLLDFEYYQPPTSLRNPVSHNVCLTLLLTPRIPRDGEADDAQPFIPSPLLRAFITTLWADECGLIQYPYEKDPKYVRMLEQLDLNEHFGVLDLPWSRDRVFKVTP
jgi:GNAT superfamily N-acetyltransferase